MRILLDKFTKKLGNHTVVDQMDLEILDGEMMALLGASGCGKTTVLFAICGFHKVNGGRILIGDRDVSNISAQERNVGFVFQSFALYPHLTVADNIGFPLKLRKDTPAQVQRKVDEIAELVHIETLLQRHPSDLSGGQQQLVALARALVRRPDVLLLDEPLANLDQAFRTQMRADIRRIQQESGITAILVTHVQSEAMSMCDRIAIMDRGRIMQVDEPHRMYDNPVTEFVAGFLGSPPISFLNGRIEDGFFVESSTATKLPVNAGVSERHAGQDVRAGIRPEHVHPDGTTRITATVSAIEVQGREVLYILKLPDGTILRSIQTSQSSVATGDQVDWGIETEKMLIFDQQGQRI